MVVLQIIGETIILRQNGQNVGDLGAEFKVLIFSFNIFYALILVINYFIRKYLIIRDEKIIKNLKIGIYIQFQGMADLLCIILSFIFIVLGLNLLF